MSLHSLVDRALAAPEATTAGLLVVVVTALGFAGWRALHRSSSRAVCYSVLLLATTLWWWLVNTPLEGRTLVVIAPTHGFTLGDSLGVPAVAVATGLLGSVAHRWLRSRRTRLS